MSAVTAPAPFAYTEMPVFRLTVEQYQEMVRVGTLTTGDPVELLEGVLVYHMPQDPDHVGSVEAAEDMIRPLLPAGWRYRSEKPIALGDSQPEPDGAIVRGTRRDSFEGHPTPADLALVIEVANTTLASDRVDKLRIYARAGIPAFWIINLIHRQIEVHTDPDPAAAPQPTYRQREVYVAGASLMVPVANVAIAVADLLPPA